MLNKRQFFTAATGLVANIVRPAMGVEQLRNGIPWGMIKEQAEQIVARESPPSIFPFEKFSRESLIRSNRRVFFHYFPPFPLSFDNKQSSADYYNEQYLRREGEHGKYADVGGYLRERPLPIGPWQSSFWRHINYAVEIQRARTAGADGFLVDVLRLPPDPGWERVRELFETASAICSDFKIIPGPDCVALHTLDAEALQSALMEVAQYNSAFRVPDGRLLVAPFAAEKYPEKFWQRLIEIANLGTSPVALMPVLLDPQLAGRFAQFSYGISYWGVRDAEEFEDGKQDQVHRSLSSLYRVLMLPVTGQDSRPKSAFFWEPQNTLLFRTAWRKAIEENAQYVQVITWNDYSESTEVSPSSGIQFLFFDLSTYYISWLKMGRQPDVIRDALYYCHRRQMIDQRSHNGDRPMRDMGPTAIKNDIELIALLRQPGVLEIEIGSNKYNKPAESGLTAFQVPAQPGIPVFRVFRGGQIILERQSDWAIEGQPSRSDLLYVGGSTTRSYCSNAGC